MPKQLVVILGMHRSGTSLVTKSIELLGYALGENLMPASEDNPKGFFEDLDIVAFNDELLATRFSSWDAPFHALSTSAESDGELAGRASALLDSKFAQTDRLVIKDPRMSLLMDFWAPVLARGGINATYVAVHRNPLDVAASLTARNGIETRHGLLLNYFYNRNLMRFLGDDAFVVDYDTFLADPVEEIGRIADHLNVTVDPAAVDTFTAGFVDRQLSHHQHTDKELSAVADDYMLALDRLMSAVASGEPVPVDEQLKSLADDRFDLELADAEFKQAFIRQRAQEEEKSALLRELNQFEAEAKLLQADLEDRDRRLGDRESHIAALQGEVKDFQQQLQRSNEVIAERDETLERQVAELAARGEEIESLLAARAELVERIGELELLDQQAREEIAELNDQVSLLHGHLDDYERIHREVLGSVSFRLGRALTWPVRKPFTALILPRLQGNRTAEVLIRFVRTCIAQPARAIRLLSPNRIRNFYLLMTQRQDLIEQVVGNYEESLSAEPEHFDPRVHHYTAEELESFELKFPEAANPRVSVVIPVYNQLDHTLMCLRSIRENLPKVSMEVVVADDCSTDATPQVLARIEGLRVVRHPENLRFLKSCNRAIDFCRGEYIFLLNNDTTVRPGWLDTLIETFETFDDAGLVGSRLLYPDGRLQEAGGIVWRDGSGWNYGRNQDPEAPEFNYLKKVDYVSGAAIMFPRQLFLDLGRFDESLAPAYYEDTDLAFAVRAAGREVYLQPRSEIVHYEGVSHGTDETTGMKQHQLINQETFHAKWRDELETRHFANGEQVVQARERSASATTVLVIDHYVPHFDKDAGSRSTWLYLKLLVQAGCNVKFIGDNYYRHEPYTSALQAIGIEVLYGREYEKNWLAWLQQNPGYVDVVYLMRPHIAEKYIDGINSLEPRPKTIYFGHDLHYLRLHRQAALHDDAEAAAEAEYWQKKEFELFAKVDQIYYPSQVEVDEIHRCQPDLPVKAIPLYAFEHFDESPVDVAERHDLLFVGGFNHPPNADGMNWFVTEVMPRVLERLPEVRLHVVGSNTPDSIRELASDNVIIEGFLTDEELDALYSRVRLSVVPLRFGAGIKGKVLEALDRGVPVVTTSIGAEGIPGAEAVMRIADDATAMADQLVALYPDIEMLEALSSQSRLLVKEHFSTEAVMNVIASDFMLS